MNRDAGEKRPSGRTRKTSGARRKDEEGGTERSVEKRSVARRREPSWRVAATNGLMNLMEASRHRVAGELKTEDNRDGARRSKG